MKNILIFLTFVILILLLVHPVDNNDLWMHIRTGEVMLENMSVASVDDYSYTVQGREWLNHQWLSQVIFFLVYRSSGVSGLIFLQAIAVFLAFLLIFLSAYKKDNWLLSVCLIFLVILFSQERFLVRPHIFSVFLFTVFIFVLHKYKYAWPDKKGRILYALIPLQILWVNLHAASIMGIFLVWAYIFGEFIDNRFRRDLRNGSLIRDGKYRRLLSVGILLVVSIGLTPYGYKAILFPLIERSEMFFIHEWLPSMYKDVFLGAGVMPYYRFFLLISFFVFISRAKRISTAHIIVFASLLYLSLSSRRHVVLYGLAMMPYIVQYAQGISFQRIPLRLKRFFKKTVIVMLTLYLVFLGMDIFSGRYYIKMGNSLRLGLGRVGYPDDAIDFLEKSGIEGNMFNDYGSGCYLIWRLYPDKRVFIDGRNTIYGADFIRKQYIEPLRDPLLFERLIKRHDIGYAFLYYALSMGNLTDIIPYLYHSKDWALIYFDGKACIFARNNKENSGIIDKYDIDLEKMPISDRRRENVYDYINTALFYEYIGAIDNAVGTLKQAILIKPDMGDLYYNLGTLYLKKGLWRNAIMEFKNALSLNRTDMGARNNLGMAYAQMGNFSSAIEEFKRVLRFRPFHPEARQNLRRAVRDRENKD